jgi:hypothetical protein
VVLDKDAEKESTQLYNDLSIYSGKTYRVKLDSKDPDSATPEELEAIKKLMRG